MAIERSGLSEFLDGIQPSSYSWKEKSGGGDFYLTSVKRVGKLLAIHVRNAVNSRQLEYTEAYRLIGLSGNTYQHFMTHNI